jgi:biopolymer transport protein TolQ
LVVKLVLGVLLALSVFSWTVILYKHHMLRSAARDSATFLATFRGHSDLKAVAASAGGWQASPHARLFAAAWPHAGRSSREELKRVIRRLLTAETVKLQSYLTFLGTTGSTAPFIGLLGTVWGIMNAFQGIGEAGSASLAVVAPGIAEALVTTAVGLAAAIPAVMAYNYYLSRVRRMAVELDDFSEELFDLLASRHPSHKRICSYDGH